MSDDDSDEATLQKSLDVFVRDEPKRTLPPKKERPPPPDSYQLRMLARSYGEWGIHRLAELARSEDVPVTVRIDCIKTLLDRGYGRPQPLEDGRDDSDDGGIRVTIRHVLDNIPGKPYRLIEASGNGHDNGRRENGGES